MLSVLAIANYRSLRQLVLPLARLTVVTGPNGSGKSSVYRALRLLAETALGGVVGSIAREGGLSSVLWAGPERFSAAVLRGELPVEGTGRNGPIRLQLGFSCADAADYSYAIDIGLPQPDGVPTVFVLDPQIKAETVWNGTVLRPSTTMASRHNALLQVRGANGRMQAVERLLPPFSSMLAEYSDPHAAPELIALRDQVRSWRFYDHFRTDAQAPARAARLGTRTPVLDHDGADFAAALATIQEIGDSGALDAAVDDAFPGASVEVRAVSDHFEALMHQPGLLRPLRAAELSDGTLRYLLWVAALLTPRPPPLLVLNEPEASLHPDLLPALGRLIAKAARESQVIVVTHSTRLVAALESAEVPGGDQRSLLLDKRLGETQAVSLQEDDVPAWRWPSR